MPDKRIERTHANVFRAMLDLVSKKDWDKITVKELCVAADINKSTFYLHFSDIFDCREKWLAYTVNESIIINDDNLYTFETILSNPKPYLSTVLDFFGEHRQQYQKLFNSPSFGLYIHDFKQCAVEIISQKNNMTQVSDYQKYTALLFVLGGIIDAVFGSLNSFDKGQLLESLNNFVCGIGSYRSTTPMRSVNAY